MQAPRQMDQITGKLRPMHKALHKRDDNMCQENKEDFQLTWRFTWMHQNKVSRNA